MSAIKTRVKSTEREFFFGFWNGGGEGSLEGISESFLHKIMRGNVYKICDKTEGWFQNLR